MSVFNKSMLSGPASTPSANIATWVLGANGNGLYYSTSDDPSNSADWTPCTVTGTAIGTVYTVQWSGTEWLAGDLNGSIYRSIDGVNFASVASPFTTNVLSLNWDGTRWQAVGGGGTIAAQSNDGGLTWTNVTLTGLISGNRAFSVKSSSTRVIYGHETATTADPHMFASTDNGVTTTTGFNPAGRTDIYRMYGIGVDPTNENIWCANLTNLVIDANERPVYSTDGGATWNSVAVGAGSIGGSNATLPYYGSTSKFISCMNRAGTPRLLQTTDGGQTYGTLQVLPAGINIYVISEESNTGVGFVATAAQGLYKTTNGGTSFATTNKPAGAANVYTVQPANQPYNIPAVTG